VFGLKQDWSLDDLPERYFTLADYNGGVARWCPGCGDFAILTAIQKICRDEQLPPEKTVCVSGIGCSSRFPHYMKTYGFHGLHGRAFPVACGIKSRRPDLHVFVSTGDGDCCSIGTAHWVHAIRYNMDMTVMLFDNHIYGLTKKQVSPTSPQGTISNTTPFGSYLPPLNPLSTVLSITNVSFLAQTIDWNPAHLHSTLLKAYHHKGLSFVRILQRCPTFTEHYQKTAKDPSEVLCLTHEEGIELDPKVARIFKNQLAHDPKDMAEARELAERQDLIPIGLFYQNDEAVCYDEHTSQGINKPIPEKIEVLERELDAFAI
jgi:2-oxoglutarate ferredoxin oxidoreductase subunit beta